MSNQDYKSEVVQMIEWKIHQAKSEIHRLEGKCETILIDFDKRERERHNSYMLRIAKVRSEIDQLNLAKQAL